MRRVAPYRKRLTDQPLAARPDGGKRARERVTGIEPALSAWEPHSGVGGVHAVYVRWIGHGPARCPLLQPVLVAHVWPGPCRTATRWAIDGWKVASSNARWAEFLIVMANTDRAARPYWRAWYDHELPLGGM
jgi:alkylation response protein AidB-like acyl-CoA dehydrogenase